MDDIGTDDGILAEMKSVLDFNPMNGTFLNQRINLMFDTCRIKFVYSLHLYNLFLWNKNNTNNSVPQIGNR